MQPADRVAAAARAGVLHPVQRQGRRGQAAPGPGRPVPVHRRAGQGAPGRRAAGDQRGRQEEGAGRRVRPGRAGVAAQGDPVRVRDHCFADRDGGHAIPYGIYDVAANTGFVNVGTGGNTAALAVESIRRWWQLAGQDAYPARRAAAGHLRRRRVQRLEEPGLEGRARGTGAGDGPGDHRVPLPARHLQVEQDRAPAVLPDHPGLARPPADQLRRHHQHHQRGHHHEPGWPSPPSWTATPAPPGPGSATSRSKTSKTAT